MATPIQPRQPQPAPKVNVPALALPEKRPMRPQIVLHAVEGWGKTTTGVYAPNAAIVMARGETGYLTLFNAGRAPEIPKTVIESWPAAIGLLDMLLVKCPYDYLVIDALSGCERLCHEYTCEREFKGDWGEHGFAGYQRGAEVAIAHWLQMMNRLERLHVEQNVGIILLSHTRVRGYRNPMGADFDKYTPDCHEKTWATVNRWAADAVLFGTFQTVTEEDRQSHRMKGTGGTVRAIYTEHTDAYVAKNRYGMEPVLLMPTDYAQNWQTIADAIAGKGAAAGVPAGDQIPE